MTRFIMAALCAAFLTAMAPSVGTAATIQAVEGYYTYEGAPSSRSNRRLFADKATAIGFPTKNTLTFLRFNRADLPGSSLSGAGMRAYLTLRHDPDLARFFRTANAENTVKLGAYGLNGAWDAVNGNDAEVVYGAAGAAAFDVTEVGAAGLYRWDVTALIDAWIADAGRGAALALSGIYGNVAPPSGFNAYAVFRPVGADGGAPVLEIAPVPAPLSALLLMSGIGALAAQRRRSA